MRVPNPAAFPHLDMSIHPCQPSWRTFSPLISPSGSNFPMGGVPPRYPPHPISTIPTFAHTCAPTLANPAPTQALCPPAHPSTHLHAPCMPFFLGFSYTHSTSCALTHSHLYPIPHGQGNSSFWARLKLIVPRDL